MLEKYYIILMFIEYVLLIYISVQNIFCVNLHVFCQYKFQCKLFYTCITIIGSFPFVNPHMPCQHKYLCKSFLHTSHLQGVSLLWISICTVHFILVYNFYTYQNYRVFPHCEYSCVLFLDSWMKFSHLHLGWQGYHTLRVTS